MVVRGAVVVGAKVVARNVQTGVTTETITSDSGNYLYPALIPGSYEVSVEMAGFKRAVQGGITLETGITRSVDLRLTVGAVTDTVEVKAQAALLESETSSVGQLIERLFELSQLLGSVFELLLGLFEMVELLVVECLLGFAAILLNFGFGLRKFVLSDLLGLLAKFVEQWVIG